MKKFTKGILLAIALTFGLLELQAQQWSDVGDPGFTVNPLGGVSQAFSYGMKMVIVNDVPHVVYNLSDGQLTVIKYSGGVWTALPSPNTGPNAPSVLPQIASDASGNIYICYKNNLSVPGFPAIITVKKFNGTSWSTVGTGGFTAGIAYGLVIDPITNNPLIATRESSTKISVYRFNGTSWAALGANDFSNTTGFLRMAMSSTGTPYVVFEDTSNSGKFSVMKFDGTNWVYVGPASFGETGTLSDLTLDIAIDGSGTPHVISKNVANGKATVLKFNGTAWVTVGQVEFTAGTFKQSRLEFSSTGVLHMVYQDGALANRASVMKFNGTNWISAGNLGFSGGEARYLDISFDAAGIPFVLFRDVLQLSGDKGTVLKLCASSSATVSSSTPASLCGSGPLNLAATSTTGALRWYNDPTNGAFVGVGTTYTTPALTATKTFSVAAYDANGCSSGRTAVTATVNAIPTITTSLGGSRCGAGTISLSATSSVGVINWFATSTGGSSLGAGNSFTTPSISNTISYYAEANNNGCLSASRTAVTATINTVPTLGVGFGSFRCGPGSVELNTSAFPTGATVAWYTASSGGSSLFTGNLFATPSITNTTTYYAEANFNGCVSTARQSLLAEVRPIPTVTASSGGETCNEGAINLNVTTSAGSQPRWYDVPSGGTSLSSSTSFITPIISATKSYYVEAMLNGCASLSRTEVVATIKPYPSLSVSDVSRCDAGIVSFEAASTGLVSWFEASTGGTALNTGAIFTTPVISVTTPYFVESNLNGCATPARSQIQAIVITTPSQPTITQNNSNIEEPVLTSSASNGNQWYRNDVEIIGATSNTYTIDEAGSYKVQVNNSGCISPFSNEVSYVITGFEMADERMLKLYPNPTVEELIIDLSGFTLERLVNIKVVDVLGRLTKESVAMGGEEIRMNVQSLNTGRYYVVAQQGTRSIAKAFIKSH